MLHGSVCVIYVIMDLYTIIDTAITPYLFLFFLFKYLDSVAFAPTYNILLLLSTAIQMKDPMLHF